jgi:NADH-quinone oxidoreductase subunit J
VLIIFSIFLTHQAGEKLPPQKLTRKLFSGLAAFCGFALVMIQIGQYSFVQPSGQLLDAGVAAIGKEMLSIDKNGYALPFEVVSMLLLAALIGCVVIAMRSPSMILPKKSEKTTEDDPLPVPSKNKMLSPVEDPGETE